MRGLHSVCVVEALDSWQEEKEFLAHTGDPPLVTIQLRAVAEGLGYTDLWTDKPPGEPAQEAVDISLPSICSSHTDCRNRIV